MSFTGLELEDEKLSEHRIGNMGSIPLEEYSSEFNIFGAVGSETSMADDFLCFNSSSDVCIS
jgi:hypothetical protein